MADRAAPKAGARAAALPSSSLPPATAAALAASLASSLAGGAAPSSASPSSPSSAPPEALSVLVCIVGGGLSGLCVASRLVAARGRGVLQSLLVLEREAAVGGTWHAAASYLGAACDVPSHLYSFSFALESGWSRRFAKAPEIQAYASRLAADVGLGPGSPSLRCGMHVDGAAWDAAAGRWRVRAHSVVSGARLEVETRFIVSAVGALYVPALPPFPGLGEFKGAAFHSARWRADVPLAGTRVAVVGVGASAAQLVPEVARVAAHLSVFQRTPSWVIPRDDMPTSRTLRWLLRSVPLLGWCYHMLLFARLELNFFALIRAIALLRPLAIGQARSHLRAQVPPGPLRDALTPHYEMGCKRVVLSDDFYPALCLPNVALVTAPIARITATGLLTEDGLEHPADVIIFATGFDVVGSATSLDVRGAGGADLRALLRGGGESYLGVAVAAFPNLFLCLGPNTGLGHNSILAMVECQTRLLLQLMSVAEAAGPRAAIAPTAEAQRASSARTEAALATTVWRACASWYNQQGGKNIMMWPWSVTRYWWETLWPRKADFEISGVD